MPKITPHGEWSTIRELKPTLKPQPVNVQPLNLTNATMHAPTVKVDLSHANQGRAATTHSLPQEPTLTLQPFATKVTQTLDGLKVHAIDGRADWSVNLEGMNARGEHVRLQYNAKNDSFSLNGVAVRGKESLQVLARSLREITAIAEATGFIDLRANGQRLQVREFNASALRHAAGIADKKAIAANIPKVITPTNAHQVKASLPLPKMEELNALLKIGMTPDQQLAGIAQARRLILSTAPAGHVSPAVSLLSLALGGADANVRQQAAAATTLVKGPLKSKILASLLQSKDDAVVATALAALQRSFDGAGNQMILKHNLLSRPALRPTLLDYLAALGNDAAFKDLGKRLTPISGPRNQTSASLYACYSEMAARLGGRPLLEKLSRDLPKLIDLGEQKGWPEHLIDDLNTAVDAVDDQLARLRF